MGCGIGLQTLWLAEAVGPGGHVTGFDMSAEFLDLAESFAVQTGLSEQVLFQQGDMNRLPFNDNTFDWIWSVDCVGYSTNDPVPLLKELSRVIKPGGNLIIMMWSSQHLLPGYPFLEARLNATSAGIAPFVKDMKPELHSLRALGRFREVGLHNLTAQTFAGNVYSPLNQEIRTALTSLFHMRWGTAQAEVSPKDWAEFQRLCYSDSPDFILNLPDYDAFFTYSLFHGKAVE